MEGIDKATWQAYVLGCQLTNTEPTLSDFTVWCEDQGIPEEVYLEAAIEDAERLIDEHI